MSWGKGLFQVGICRVHVASVVPIVVVIFAHNSPARINDFKVSIEADTF